MNATLNGPTGRISLSPAPMRVGRVPDNQLVVNDTQVSSHHAQIYPDGQGYSIVDLGSTNGTFVNEQRLTPNMPYHLNANDRIRVGNTFYSYEMSYSSPDMQNVSPIPGSPGIAPSSYNSPPVMSGSASGTPELPPTVAVAGANYQNPTLYVPQPVEGAYTPQMPVQYPNAPGYAPPPPGMPVTPGFPAPPQQQKKRNPLLLILGIVGGIVLLGIIGCVVLFAFVFNAVSGPTNALNAYCNGIKSSDYQSAYNQLSSSTRNNASLYDFTEFAQENGGSGHVSSCNVSSVSIDNGVGKGVIDYSYKDGSSKSISYTLTSESDGWKLTNVNVTTPGITLRIFCDAIGRKDYQTAYNQLTSDTQAGLTEADFAKQLSNASSCTASNITPTNTGATATLTYTLTDGTTSPATDHLIMQNGVWKIHDQS